MVNRGEEKIRVGLVYLFPRFSLVGLFFSPRLSATGYKFSHTCEWLHVFPRSYVRSYSLCVRTSSCYFLKLVMFFLDTLGERKRAIARVTVKRGSGNVTVNDIPFTKYFGRMEDRYGMNLQSSNVLSSV